MKSATSPSPAAKPSLSVKGKKRLSDDLTVVLLRGNGIPRSFSFSLDAFNRALTALSVTFLAALAAGVIFAGLWFTRGISLPRLPRAPAPSSREAAGPPVALPSPATPAVKNPTNFVEISPAPAVALVPVSEESKNGLWQQLKGAVNNPSSPSSGTAGGPSAPALSAGAEGELQKEVLGLRKDIAALGAKAEGRRDITPGNPGGLLQFFGPRSTVATEAESSMRVRNPRVSRESASRQIIVDFELHNVDPDARQERGYIVALAKTPDLLVSYPNAVFAPSQNILLDYTKGETFAVSRFRQARATFAAGPLEGKRASFQVLLFGTDGKVLANLPVEDNR